MLQNRHKIKNSELEWHTSLAEKIDKYEEFSEYDYQKYLRHLVKETKIKNSDVVLELGCGTGAFTSKLSNYNIVSLDISDKMLLKAKRNKCVQGDMEFLPFQDNTFDIVFAPASLHHLPCLHCCASESYRVLKCGGRFFSLDPNKLNPLGWAEMNISFIRKTVREKCMGHFPLTPNERYFTAGEIERVFRDAGFKQIKTYTINFVPFKRNMLLRSFEVVLEKIPVINRLGGTLVHSAVKN